MIGEEFISEGIGEGNLSKLHSSSSTDIGTECSEDNTTLEGIGQQIRFHCVGLDPGDAFDELAKLVSHVFKVSEANLDLQSR